MLAVTKFEADYVEATRKRIKADVSAFKKLDSPPAALEHAFFNNLVLALDRSFVHRVRKNEGKDGNPLNEVRILVDSLIEHGGVMIANSTINLKPEESVLGYEFGDRIEVGAKGFERLADGFFAEIASRFR